MLFKTFFSKNLKTILYIILLLFLILFLKNNFKNMIIKSLGGYVNKETIIEIDTFYTVGKVDTLAVFNHYVKTKGIILNPTPEIRYKWLKVLPDTQEEVVIDSIKEFNVQIKDSLLDGTFKIINDFKGNLVDNEFNYKPLFPKYIRRVDTVKIIKTVTNTLNNQSSKIGIGVGYNNLQSLSVLGSYTTKDDWQFIYEVGKNVNDIPINLGNLNVNTTHSIKIIKHF